MKVFDPLLGQVRYRLAPEHVRVDLNPQEGGYEYLWARDGVYKQARRRNLIARVRNGPPPAVPYAGLGEAPVWVELPVRVPAGLLHEGLNAMRVEPTLELVVQFAFDPATLRWRLRVPPGQQRGVTRSQFDPSGEPAHVLVELHTHPFCALPALPVPSGTDDADEGGFRLYGVVGDPMAEAPMVRMRVGVYGAFAPVPLTSVFVGDLHARDAAVYDRLHAPATGWTPALPEVRSIETAAIADEGVVGRLWRWVSAWKIG